MTLGICDNRSFGAPAQLRLGAKGVLNFVEFQSRRYEGELRHQGALFGLWQVGLQNDARVLSLKAR